MQLRAERTVLAAVWSGRGLRTALVFSVLISAALAAPGADPLHDRIDKAVESAFVGIPGPLIDDGAFLRRLTLDLTGRIPSAREARAFLDDPAPDKRTRLVDRLLASPEHVRFLATTFDVWLMERRGDKHVKTDEWRAYLVAFFKANRPYNELAREILGSDGSDPAKRPASKFTLDRDVAPDALTRDVGRMFFGMDLQCAQCHDHPRIDDYLQRDYYGLYAFLSRASLFQPDAKKPAVVMEKPDGDVAFKSVFTKAEGATRPRMPDGLEIDEPSFAKGDEYQVKPDPKDKTLRPVPKFSRRSELARLTGEGASRAFNRNVANRLWAHMMGRGLVEPLDLHHADNPASHPELLDLLGTEFAAMKYDVRAFLRELALTRTYQRGIDMPATLADPSTGSPEQLAALDAEAGRRKELSTRADEAMKKAAQELDAARKSAGAVAAEVAKADAATVEAKKANDAAAALRDAAKKTLAAREDLLKSISEAAQKAKEAAARLADDKELAAAAATFEARAGKLTAEVAAVQKDAAEKTAAAAAKAEGLAAAEKNASVARARLAEANAGIRTLFGAELQAEARMRETKAAAIQAAARARDTRAIVEYGALQASALQSRETLKRIRSELAAARDAVAKLPSELPAREARVAETRQALEAAAQAQDQARRELEAKDEARRAVADASAKADEVAQKAPQDAELVATAAKVKARKDAIGAEVAELKKAAAARAEARRKAAEALAAAERARDDLAGAKQRIAVLETQLKPATEKEETDRARRNESFARLTTICTSRFAVAVLDPLTPEQICWSMMQATGVVDLQRAAAEAEFAKKTPALPDAERTAFVEGAVQAKLGGNEAAFVKVFGAAPGQPQDEFYATVDQALFLENGGLVRGWLAPSGENLTARLLKLENPQELARELYLAMYTRPPSDRERDEVLRHLAARPQARLAAVQEIVWAMLTSVEFRFKH
ncbi:MAG: DUF1549 domain-containing protein [Planctomycetes bacterium]|nr:DUF1549 domain-containing protein [Planctomycetota bacterium]